MLRTVIGAATLITPAPEPLNTAPSPARLFHAAPVQFRLVVSHSEFDAPLSHTTSPARTEAGMARPAATAKAMAGVSKRQRVIISVAPESVQGPQLTRQRRVTYQH